MSDKRRARISERDECRRVVMDRCNGVCEACARVHSGPERRAVDVHEVLTRARGGSIYDPTNCLGVCRPCHDWIGDHPLEAAALGLVKHSWAA